MIKLRSLPLYVPLCLLASAILFPAVSQAQGVAPAVRIVSPIDESQLFYLESRGVPTASAELLIALGFLDDVLGRFPVPGVRPGLRQAVAAKLAASGLGAPGSGAIATVGRSGPGGPQ